MFRIRATPPAAVARAARPLPQTTEASKPSRQFQTSACDNPRSQRPFGLSAIQRLPLGIRSERSARELRRLDVAFFSPASGNDPHRHDKKFATKNQICTRSSKRLLADAKRRLSLSKAESLAGHFL